MKLLEIVIKLARYPEKKNNNQNLKIFLYVSSNQLEIEKLYVYVV